MSRDPRRASAFRCLLLWSVLSGTAVVLLLLARGELARAHHQLAAAGGAAFAPALGLVAIAALAISVTWLWWVMTAATVEALHGVHRVDPPGARGVVRRLVLAGCGVALAASVAPAHADDLRGVAGQPPQPLVVPAAVATPMGEHVVDPGESLWAITAGRLGAGASDAEIDHGWRALWRANGETVGSDPDLIEPGQRLELPGVLR